MVDFDVIVVGAGHAGIEAGFACANRGLQTLMITTNLDRIGYMSCNPAIGGLAKGHMVREIDMLGGMMGLAADATCIQFKRLNSRKGPAVRGSRSQCDKDLYSEFMRGKCSDQPNLELFSGEVKTILFEGHRCVGVSLDDGSCIRGKAVIITTGTFMNAMMHIGDVQTSGGRSGDKSTVGISDQLREMGFRVQRLKTGTPPRLEKESIDWSKLDPQFGDEKYYPFSFRSSKTPSLPQVPCFLGYTTERTHEIIRRNLHKSPMYSGQIEGIGPRYCPSIEDKIVRFADKNRHQTFLEPEGLNSNLIYLQGISTSLPLDVQVEFLQTISGLENVKVVRAGYAVEYDFVEPTQLTLGLETKAFQNLFLAGQINGTSGYEEAAAQGFVAGINAGNKVLGLDLFVLPRHLAYVGVMIDDLVTKGTQEPYRMFTSRAEHRLALREDNTLDRLFGVSKSLGIIDSKTIDAASKVIEDRDIIYNKLKETRIFPNEETQGKLVELCTAPITNPVSLEVLLRRPEVCFEDLSRFGFDCSFEPSVYEPLEIRVKYAGYIEMQEEQIYLDRRNDETLLPDSIEYRSVKGLSVEEVEKLDFVRPRSLGQALRISGVNPSAARALLVHLRGRSKLTRTSINA